MASFTLPLSIFVAEVCVVTLTTVRIISVARGRKFLAPLLGFFEICVWLFAIGQVMRNLSDPACYLAFAAGFTLGNFLGILLDGRLALGTLLVRVITPRDSVRLVEGLRAAGYGVTCLEGRGAAGAVQVVLTVVPRKELETVTTIIRGFDPDAFYSVDDVQAAARGVFPTPKRLLAPFRPFPERSRPRESDQPASLSPCELAAASEASR
jgi:uncharacterized protein YebE (UPF0316 family)